MLMHEDSLDFMSRQRAMEVASTIEKVREDMRDTLEQYIEPQVFSQFWILLLEAAHHSPEEVKELLNAANLCSNDICFLRGDMDECYEYLEKEKGDAQADYVGDY